MKNESWKDILLGYTICLLEEKETWWAQVLVEGSSHLEARCVSSCAESQY